VVPAAQVNAPVESVGLDPQGVIGVPSQPMDAAWYNGSPSPGEPGNAIVDGHLDWWTGPGVFGHLSQVQTGDQIDFVQADRSVVTFVVTGEQVYGANAQIPASMMVKSGPATVSLITCTGSWDAGQSEYLQRLVVNGSLVPG
jgi:sortase (surface protein transpeptidase)